MSSALSRSRMDLDWLTPQRQQALCISDDQTWSIDASATSLHITSYDYALKLPWPKPLGFPEGISSRYVGHSWNRLLLVHIKVAYGSAMGRVNQPGTLLFSDISVSTWRMPRDNGLAKEQGPKATSRDMVQTLREMLAGTVAHIDASPP